MAETIWIEDADGGEREVKLPVKMEVCQRCNGRGVHDAWEGGFSMSDDFVDDDFLEDYRSGMYDVACTECKGRNVVEVVDEERLTPEQLKAWNRQCQDLRDSYQESRMERLMGA
jgi:RecJ-like exonuclease